MFDDVMTFFLLPRCWRRPFRFANVLVTRSIFRSQFESAHQIW